MSIEREWESHRVVRGLEGRDSALVPTSAEELIVGTVLRNLSLYHTVSFISHEDFFYKLHRRIWLILEELIREKPDLPPGGTRFIQAVYNQKYRDPALTDERLKYLLSKADEASLYQAGLMVVEARDRRRLAGVLEEGLNLLQRGEGFEVVLQKVFKEQNNLISVEAETPPLESYIRKALDRMEGKRYIPTGLEELDDFIGGGLPFGAMTVLGARPSMGKTSLARRIVRRVVEEKGRVYWASFDQSPEQVLLLEACRRMGLPYQSAIKYAHEDEGLRKDLALALEEVAAEWRERVYLDGQVAPVETIVRRIRRIHLRRKLDLVVVDYLQFIPSSRESRVSDIERVSGISRTLKALALELDVAVLALAQLSRSTEQRIDKIPQNADLRDSGQVEQDADIIFLLHRPSYYDPEKEPREAWLFVSKNKTGPTGKLILNWDPDLAEFR